MSTMLGMFNIFSGLNDTLWKIAVLVAVACIIIAVIKYPQSRWVVGIMLGIAYICLTVYSGIQLNYYYSATGGIYGQIKNLYNPNQVNITSSVEYSFENVVLTQDTGDTYSARIESDSVLELVLEEDTKYGVYVNGMPCNNVQISSDYVLAEYEYNFLDEDMSLLLNDTLTFKFAFYTNSTYLIVSTNGGTKAVDYWMDYFNKNTFIVTIDNKGYEIDNDLQFVNDTATTNIVATVTYDPYITVHGLETDSTTFRCFLGSTFEVSYSNNIGIYKLLAYSGASIKVSSISDGYTFCEVLVTSLTVNLQLVDNSANAQEATVSISPALTEGFYMDLYGHRLIPIDNVNDGFYVGQTILYGIGYGDGPLESVTLALLEAKLLTIDVTGGEKNIGYAYGKWYIGITITDIDCVINKTN